MKKILILVKEVNQGQDKLVNYLSQNIKDTEIILGLFEQVSFEIEKGEVDVKVNGSDLKNFDFVYFRQVHKYLQLAGALAYFLKQNNIPFIDKSFENIGASGDKLGNIVKLALSNISVVPSIYVSRQNLLKEKASLISKLDFPIFTKNLSKQKRQGLFIINNDSDFEKLLNKDRGFGFLFQAKMEIKEEYRIVVMGGSVVAVHKEGVRKFDKNEMIVDSSESIGGWVNPDSINKQMCQEAVAGAKALDLDIGGVDASVDTNGNIFIIEINRGPGLTMDPNVSPELPALANYFQKLVH